MRIAGKHFSFPEWQLVDHVVYPDVVSDLIVRPVGDGWVVRIIGAVILVCVGKCVMREHLQATREALFHLNLQRVVFAACIIAQVVALVGGAALQYTGNEARRAGKICKCICRIWVIKVSKVVVVGATIRLRRFKRSRTCGVTAISDHGRIIDVVGGPVASEHMSALIADVSYLDRGRVSNLVLNCNVPGIEGWQALGGWTDMRLHAKLGVLSGDRVENRASDSSSGQIPEVIHSKELLGK